MSLSTQVYLAFCLVLFLYNLRFKDQTCLIRFKATILEKNEVYSFFALSYVEVELVNDKNGGEARFLPG